jgi:hypothetical protein
MLVEEYKIFITSISQVDIASKKENHFIRRYEDPKLRNETLF